MGKKINTVSGFSPMDAPENFNDRPFYGYDLDPDQLNFVNAIWNPNNDIIWCNSKAGTGKTTLATGVANLLVQYGFFEKIVYIMCPYGESKQGWLPGTITEKSNVYFEAFYQACINCGINTMTAINTESMVNQKNGTGYITTITDTFLRGSNLENAVVICDEFQNATVKQIKKILTRVNNNVKVIAIGHSLQCDLPNPRSSGFDKYIEHFRGKDRCAICNLTINHRGWISQWADELPE